MICLTILCLICTVTVNGNTSKAATITDMQKNSRMVHIGIMWYRAVMDIQVIIIMLVHVIIPMDILGLHVIHIPQMQV